MNAFRKYFNKSKKFANFFYINFGVLALLLMFAFTRMMTGLMRDVPAKHIMLKGTLIKLVVIVLQADLRVVVLTEVRAADAVNLVEEEIKQWVC